MRKLFFFLACLLMTAQAYAVPACPYVQKVTQPDGTELSIVMHGDEYYHYITTEDGYTVVKNNAGYYVYAQLSDGAIAETSIVAKDLNLRSINENAMLKAIGKGIIDKNAVKNVTATKLSERKKVLGNAKFDYSKFKGLIVLINFNDAKFLRTDAKDFYNNMVNQKNYSGYTDLAGQSTRYNNAFTGSVRDFFYDNSMGVFDPNFTVVGPVTVNRSIDYPDRTNNAGTVFREALAAADSLVDFSQFDTDGNGQVDMVYFIVAGSGSNSDSENSQHLWPHASYLSGLTLDGVSFGRYACSTEYLYNTRYNLLDGIGTICHEFGHVLGLPDLYDTNYDTSGQSHDPGSWDIMASGSYLNYGRTPAGYSLYERYALGFSTPKLLKEKNTYTLNPLNTSNEGYRLNTKVNNEYFLIENRQKSKWDAALPGHGMLVVRVDSTNTSVWDYNQVNAYSARNYYELLRAGLGTSGESSADPFPGDKGVVTITNSTAPNLRAHDKSLNDNIITRIAENNGIITFNLDDEANVASLVEDFENMPATTDKNAQNVPGTYTKWNFTKANVESPTDTTLCNGKHAAGMIKPSSLTMVNKVNINSYIVSFRISNSSMVISKFQLYSKTDTDTTWNVLSNATGETTVEVGANATVTASFPVSIFEPVLYKINMIAGSTTKKCYIDDFTIFYDKSSGVNDIISDKKAGDFKAYKSGNNVTVKTTDEGYVNIYTVTGQLVDSKKAVDGSAEFTLPSHGFYIINQGSKSVKIVL
jgi:immune inhibitor A